MISIKDPAFGAVGDGVTDDTAAIMAAITSASALGGTVFAPPGTYKYWSISVPHNVVIQGDGSACTTFLHAGTGVGVKYGGTGTFAHHGMRISGIKFKGNNTVGSSGLEMGDFYGAALRDVVIDDYTEGTGLRILNEHYWSEGLSTDCVRIMNCKTSVEFKRSATSEWESFGYMDLRGLALNVPANGVGLRIGGDGAECYTYSARMDLTVWLASGAVGVFVGVDSTFRGAVTLAGEPESGASNTTLVLAPGTCIFTGGAIVEPGTFTTLYNGDVRILNTMDTSTPTATTPGVIGGPVPNTQAFAGIAAVTQPNMEHLVAYGYEFGSNPVFRVAAKPYSTDATGPWDSNAKAKFTVNANGDVVIHGGKIVLPNGTTVSSGAGSPEGVVAAPRGSTYTRTDGGASTTLYVKTSGTPTSKTGWTAK